MSLVASDKLIATIDGSGLYSEERNLWLWEQVPAELRLTEFSYRTLPDHPAFRWKLIGRGSWRGFDLYSLPVAMQRELAYCFWQIIESGLTINMNYSQLVWWLIILDEDYRAAKKPARCARSWTCRWRAGSGSWPRRAPGGPGSCTGCGRATGRRRCGALPASGDRLRPARVVAARHLEPEVRRADPDPRARARPGDVRL